MKQLQTFEGYWEPSDQKVPSSGPEIYDVYTPKASPTDMSISFEYYVDSGKCYGMDIYPEKKCLELYSDSKSYWLSSEIEFYKAFIYRFEESEQARRDLFNFIQFTVSSVLWCHESWIKHQASITNK